MLMRYLNFINHKNTYPKKKSYCSLLKNMSISIIRILNKKWKLSLSKKLILKVSSYPHSISNAIWWNPTIFVWDIFFSNYLIFEIFNRSDYFLLTLYIASYSGIFSANVKYYNYQVQRKLFSNLWCASQ